MKELPHEPKKLLTGDEIMKILGIPAGPKIAEVLEKMRLLQLEKKLTTKSQATAWVLEEF